LHRRKVQVEPGDLLCYRAVWELRKIRTGVAERLKMSSPIAGYAVNRGKKIAQYIIYGPGICAI